MTPQKKFFMMQEVPQHKAQALSEWLQQQGWSSTHHNTNNAAGVDVQKMTFSNGSDMCVHMESDLWEDWKIDGPKDFILNIRQRFDMHETLYERCMNHWVLSSADIETYRVD